MPPTKAQRPHCIGPENGLLFKLRFQNSENFVHGVLFEVGFLDQCFTRQRKHTLRSSASDTFQGLDHPVVDFVAEFVEVNTVLDHGNQTAKVAVALIGSLLGEKLL